jgi:hypothetical protein
MPICDVKFRKFVELSCYDELERAGFTRFAKEGVDWPLQNDFHCWVGLNTALYLDRLEVNPFVGVHVVPIARLKTLEGSKYNRRVATYALHMGELPGAADEPAFSFTPAQTQHFVATEIKRLAHLYKTLGVEYAKSIASYECILPLLKQRIKMLGGYPESVACCLFLMGRVKESSKFVKEFLEIEPEYFSKFAIPFLHMMENGEKDRWR